MSGAGSPAGARAFPPYLAALRLEGEPCLVVGGGAVAARKAAALLDCGAAVTVVAPRLSAELESLAAERGGSLEIQRRPYRRREVEHYRLAVTATGIAEIDRNVYLDGAEAGVLVNAADDPESCSYFVPALLRRGDVSVAVSTGGASPYLASWVRTRIAASLPDGLALLAELVGEARSAVRQAGVSTEGLDWEGLVQGRLLPLVETGEEEAARSTARGWAESVVESASTGESLAS